MNVTLILIIATSLISFLAFQSPDLMDRLLMRPYAVRHNRQYYRFITSGFVHANWAHLLINMFVFYQFGNLVFRYYQFYFEDHSLLSYGLLYFGGMIVANLPSYFKHQDHPWYASLGASGAISAIVFAYILMEPMDMLYFFGIIPLPAILFGVLYLIYSQYMARRGGDNINHDAHLYGALFGFFFTLAMRPDLLSSFIEKIFHLQL